MNEQEFRYRDLRGQSKRGSMTESLLNVAIGYGIAVAAQEIIFPLFGVHIPLHDSLAIGAIFTVISIMRSYALRRAFNWWHCRSKIQPLACPSPVIPPGIILKRGQTVGRPEVHAHAAAGGGWRDGVYIAGKEKS